MGPAGRELWSRRDLQLAQGAVPGDRLLEAFLELDLRLEAEDALGLLGRGDADLDVLVVAAHRLVADDLRPQRAVEAHRGLDGLREVDDLHRLLVGNVDDLADRLGRAQRADEAVDRVAHVRERADLLAVAVDLHLLAVEEVLEEDGERAAPPARVVAGAVGVEQAQDRDLQAALLVHAQGQVLVEVLRRGVAPTAAGRRTEDDLAVLAEGCRGVAVDVGGRGEDDRHVELERDVERGLRAVDVDVHGVQGPAEARDLAGGEVHDAADVLEVTRQARAVTAVVLQQLEAGTPEDAAKVLRTAHREVVDPDDLAPLVEQALDQVRADEAGGTRHTHGGGKVHAALLCSAVSMESRARTSPATCSATPAMAWP